MCLSSHPLNSRFGFARIDLFASVAMAAFLAALIFAGATLVNSKRRLAVCTGNLQLVDRALILFAADQEQKLPFGVLPGQGDLWWWYKEQVKGYIAAPALSSKASPFACPNDRGYSDPQPFCRTARFDFNSYAFNGVNTLGMPNIAGSRIPAIADPGKTLLVMEWTAHAPLSWHHSKTGHSNAPFYCDAESVAGFVDGHVAFTKMYYDGYNAAYTRDPIPGYSYKFSSQ